MKYNELLLEAETYMYGEMQDLNKAESCLLEFIDKTKNLYSLDKQIFSFNNSLEYILFFNKTKYQKEHVFVSILYHRAHRLLGKVYLKRQEYDKAKEEYIKALEYNPMDMRTHFYVADLERIKGDYASFYKYNNFLYQDIYEPKALAKFYRNLGVFYRHDEKNELAYAIFKYSLNFDFNDEAIRNLKEISTDKTLVLSEHDNNTYISLLKENNIPLSILEENMQLLKAIYKDENVFKKEPTLKSLIGEMLSYFDSDYKKWQQLITIKNPEANFSLKLSSVWSMVDPNMYEKLGIDKQTKYYLYYDDTKISIMDLAITSNLDEVYEQNKQYFKEQNIQILKEGSAFKNKRPMKFIFIKCNQEYIFEIYFVVSNHIIGASTILSHGFFLGDKNVKRLWDVVNTIKEA